MTIPTRPAKDLAKALRTSAEFARTLALEHLPDEYFVRRGKRQKALRADRFEEAVEFLESVRRVKVDGAPPVDYAKARAEREFYEARLAEVKLKREMKQLIPVLEVERHVTNAFFRLRQRLMQLPAQHMQSWHEARTVREAEMLAESALRDTLIEFRCEVEGLELANGADYEDPPPKVEA